MTPTEKLLALRDELAAVTDPLDWDKVETWAARTELLITRHFPEFSEKFKELTKMPHWLLLPTGGNWVDGQAEIEERRNNQETAANAHTKILAWLDSIIALDEDSDTGDHKVESSAKPSPGGAGDVFGVRGPDGEAKETDARYHENPEVAEVHERWLTAKAKSSRLAEEYLAEGSGYGDSFAQEGDKHRMETARYEAEQCYREYQDTKTRNQSKPAQAVLGESKHHCNKCLVETTHLVLHQEENRWRDEIEFSSGLQDFWYTEWYSTIKCGGCGSVSILLTTQSEANEEPSEEFFPPRTFRRKPLWLVDLPRESLFERSYVAELVDEIYTALQNGSLRLAVMGVRALLEAAMIDKVGDQGSFKKNIDKFETDGFISSSQRKVLEPTIEAGHAVLHRGYSPGQDDVVLLMDIAESIIESVYVTPKKARLVAEATPKRK
jgi:Domain of unknown function (DUF4145)